MTITQMQAFLEVARCKNISEAAKRLYITQPALGRQLTAIERELNMQLMIRSNRGVRLTPAGIALQEELEKAMEHVKSGISKAEQASYGYSGNLTIGLLDELDIMDELVDVISYFELKFPNINIKFKRNSFKALVDGIYDGSLDAVISLSVNFLGCKDLNLRNIRRCQEAFAVPIGHPLAKKEALSFGDFRGVPLAIVDRDDCSEGVKFVEQIFYENAGFFPDFYFTTTMKDAMFWVESGKKCAVINMDMTVAKSKHVKMYPFDGGDDFSIQLASKAGNESYEIHLLNEYFTMQK
ncbi:MAG: LysR family transcriptional regulator [Eubacterium sp.]|nr:LysR family transcriptional regulator [Eubacterium sp.]